MRNIYWTPWIMGSLVLLFILLIASCIHTYGIPERQYSEDMFEEGTVHDTAFVPEGHGHKKEWIRRDGKSSPVSVDVTIPERYAVVFKCDHGKFVIDGPRGKEMYQKLDRGDSVTIKYREIYIATKKGTNFYDLDFLDATRNKKKEDQ